MTDRPAGSPWDAASGRSWTTAGLIVGLATFTLLIWTGPVPSVGDCSYLLSAYRSTHPAFLASDWTLGHSQAKAYLFDLVAGQAMRVLSLPAVAWIGRALLFAAMFTAVFRIGRRLGLTPVGNAVAVLAWIGYGQSLVGFERPIYSFNPKAVAWALALFAIDGVLARRYLRSGVLLGAAVAVHPLVGGTLAAAIGLAMLVDRTGAADWARLLGVAIVVSLPGLVPSISEIATAVTDPVAEWRFQALYRLWVHLDFTRFDPRRVAALGAMVAWVGWFGLRSKDRAWRFLAVMAAALVPVFLFGVLATVLGRYDWLAIFPFRILPPLAQLLFFVGLVRTSREALATRTGLLAPGVAIAILLLLPNPVGSVTGNFHQNQTWRAMLSPASDHNRSLAWVADHTPATALLVVSPTRVCAPYFSRRAQVSYFDLARFDRLQEMRERFLAHVGELGDRTAEVRVPYDSRFTNLPETSIAHLVATYGGDYLVTRAAYSLPVVHREGEFSVYDLAGLPHPPAGRDTVPNDR